MFFIDDDLKKILTLFPPRAVRVVDKFELIRAAPGLLRSLQDTRVYEEELVRLRTRLEVAGVTVVNTPPESSIWKPDASAGMKILQIYFRQILDPDPLHLDFRSRHFSLGSANALIWNPSKLRARWSEAFRAGVKDIYDGFYFSDSVKFLGGLEMLGLFKNLPAPKDREHVAGVFFEHFGEGRTAPIRFSMEKLRNSFGKIFDTLTEYGIKVDSQFVLLGTTLCTMYTTLEAIETPLDVRAAYLSVRGKI
ncbi:MAG: hypothetical protein ABIR96_08395 [Bdellovibrionota bacterium]